MIGGIQLPQMLQQGVDPESPEIIRLAFARGEVPMGLPERLGVLTCLIFDPSVNVKDSALKALVELEDEFLEKALTSPSLQPLSLELLLAHRPCNDTIKQAMAAHPNIGEKTIKRFALSTNKTLLDILADNQRGLTKWPQAAQELLSNPALDLAVKGRLASLLEPEVAPEVEVAVEQKTAPDAAATASAPDESPANLEAVDASDADDEYAGMAEAMAQFEEGDSDLEELPESLLNDAHIESDSKNINQLIQTMSISEKIKLATLGSKSARRLLVRDTNRVVVNAVIRSPKIQEDEVIALAQDKTTADEVLLYILIKKEWLKNYQVRLGLCQNPKTPIPKALRLLATLQERDLRMISKSKNVSGAISGTALRTLMRRNKK